MADEKTDDVVVKIQGEGEQQLSLLIDDPSDKPAKQKSKPSDDGVDALKKQLSSSRQREEELTTAREAEAVARRRAEAEAAEAKKQVVSTQTEAITAALTSAKGEADALQGQIQQALESGEYKVATELQRKLARAEATIMRYEDAKTELDAQAKKPPPEEKRPEPQSSDPFEAQISKLPPRSKTWLREHREYATDPKLNKQLIAAHHVAMAEDHTYESDAYFQRIEEHLGLGGDDGGEPEVVEETPRRQPRHSAPVSREAPANRHGVSGNRVTLTQAEVGIARDLGMTPQEYAAFKRQAVAAGHYDNNR